MPTLNISGIEVAYDVIGAGEPWALTPGGRFARDFPGVRETAEALATGGKQVLIWDRPNTGSSDVCFDGDNESAMQADTLAGLIRELGMAPAVVAGGSGGARVSLLTAARHRDVAKAVTTWWISGGPYGLLSLGVHYCSGSIAAAWKYGMEAVAGLPEWQEVQARNPGNRDRILAQDRQTFIRTMERWMLAYYPREGELIPGVADEVVRALDIPALVFRSGESDAHHTRETSERLAGLLPQSQLVEPPWGDSEWNEQSAKGQLFVRWPLLVPQLLEWSAGFGPA
ncbi:MAG TPA: alpha/beta hydrolase [Acidimicrobiales bacterium]|nr:alpha/beta hydrolase [Acidimicrobiales bacterium]